MCIYKYTSVYIYIYIHIPVCIYYIYISLGHERITSYIYIESNIYCMYETIHPFPTSFPVFASFLDDSYQRCHIQLVLVISTSIHPRWSEDTSNGSKLVTEPPDKKCHQILQHTGQSSYGDPKRFPCLTQKLLLIPPKLDKEQKSVSFFDQFRSFFPFPSQDNNSTFCWSPTLRHFFIKIYVHPSSPRQIVDPFFGTKKKHWVAQLRANARVFLAFLYKWAKASSVLVGWFFVRRILELNPQKVVLKHGWCEWFSLK